MSNWHDAGDAWRETVRDLYDDLHFGEDNVFTGSRLAARLIAFIEERHAAYFAAAAADEERVTTSNEE